MPVVPTFEAQGTAQVGGGLPTLDPSIAARPGEALAQAGAQLSETGGAFFQRYMEARRQADAANIAAGALSKLNDASFRWSKTPDNMAAQNGFNTEAAQIKAGALDGVSDPLVKSAVEQHLDQMTINLSHETRHNAFLLESSSRRGDLDTRLNTYATMAAQAPNDQARQQLAGLAQGDIDGSVKGGWLHPEEGAQRKLAFASRIQDVTARQDMNRVLDLGDRDPDAAYQLARKINDPTQYPGLLPQTRESLGRAAENMAYRLTIQAASRAQREDRADALALRQTQAANEGAWLNRVYAFQDGKGPEPDLTAASDAYAKQQISLEGLRAIHSALDTARQGKDDPLARNDLQQRIAEGEDVHADIRQAIIDHKLSSATAGALMTQNAARQKGGESAIDRGNFNALKTQLGGDAVEKGMLDFGNQAHAQQINTWSRAQIEWGKRVVVGGEDSNAVLADMLQRYQSTKYPPATWRAPRFGAVGSTADVAAVWQRTKDAAAANKISPDQLQAESELLEQYRKFYADQDARKVALAPKPAAGGDKAKLRGVQTGGEQ